MACFVPGYEHYIYNTKFENGIHGEG